MFLSHGYMTIHNHMLRRHAYFLFFFLVEVVWLTYMLSTNAWNIFFDHWPATVTMAFGSFVAGSTAEGGAFIAFPVFTKFLGVSASQASIFGLMIQSVGMTAASIAIFSLKIKILPKIILLASVGGFVGMYCGQIYLNMPEIYPRLFFTTLVTSFGVVLFTVRWVLKWPCCNEIVNLNLSRIGLVLFFGFLGGLAASQTGAGINMLIFILLVLTFGIKEKIAIPTSVVIMAINSIFGFGLHYWNGTIDDASWNYWLAAVPVVAIGAPLGAYVVSRVNVNLVTTFLLMLIFFELLTTLIWVPFTQTSALASIFILLVSFLSYGLMLRYQRMIFNKI